MSSFSVAALISSQIFLKDPFREGESPSNLQGSPSFLFSLKSKGQRRKKDELMESDKFLENATTYTDIFLSSFYFSKSLLDLWSLYMGERQEKEM
jgi:hypothetical protein